MVGELYSAEGAGQGGRERGVTSSLGSIPSHMPRVLLSLVLEEGAFP